MAHAIFDYLKQVHADFLTLHQSVESEPAIEQVIDTLALASEGQADYLESSDFLAFCDTLQSELLQGVYSEVKGSLEEKTTAVCMAFCAEERERYGEYGYVIAVFDDSVIACYYDEERGSVHWRIPYTFDTETKQVTFPTEGREPVELETVVKPVAQQEAVEEQAVSSSGVPEGDLDQETVYKTDNGKRFTADAYLIVPDPESPSTWKVRIEETPGKVTVAQLGRAYAALTKGFRGNKVQASSDAVSSALKRLKGLYKKLDAPWPADKKKTQACEWPAWLLQGDDPPGGEQELVQSNSCLLEQESYDEKTGVLRVKMIVTRANCLNANNQVYPREVWEDNMPRLQALLEQGRLTGESEHPEDGRPRLERTCVKYTSIWMEGDEVWAQADILPTDPLGKNLQILVQNNVNVDISSRGRGRTKRGMWQADDGTEYENVDIVQRGFRCDAFDPVASGASPGARIVQSDVTAQSETAATDSLEELEMSKELEKLAQQVEQLTAQQATIVDALGKLASPKPETPEPPVVQTEEKKSDPILDQKMSRMEALLVRDRLESLIAEAASEYKWKQQWLNLYRKNLENRRAGTVEELEHFAKQTIEVLQAMISQAPVYPGNGHVVQGDKGERGPRTPNEMIEILLDDAGIKDDCPYDPLSFVKQGRDGEVIEAPDNIRTPRRQLRQWLRNIAQEQDANWNGKAAMAGLMRLYQGYDPQFVHEQFDRDWLNRDLTQACDSCTTSVGSGGAPISALFIFPIVTRVFPQLIVTELASVQPMDRPDGKIFFWDVYRDANVGVDSVDEAGDTVTGKMRMDRSSSFSSSYADDPGECGTANCLQGRMSAKSVTAQTKKLRAKWSIELMQDLRAYHNMSIDSEMVTKLALEIALEWNQIALNEMIAAVASNRNYGTVAPSGYTQKEWNEELVRFIEASSVDIFSRRNDVMTHVVAGPQAWIKMSATSRLGFRADGSNPSQFAGLTLTPFQTISGLNVKTYMTNFWNGVNTDKILVIRRGQDWSDTPYVWAPYVDYVSPIINTPTTIFEQQVGVMSRAAHKVVVSDALASVTIQSGITGTSL